MSRIFEQKARELLALVPALYEEMSAADPHDEEYATLKKRLHRSIGSLAKAAPLCTDLCEQYQIDIDQDTPPSTQGTATPKRRHPSQEPSLPIDWSPTPRRVRRSPSGTPNAQGAQRGSDEDSEQGDGPAAKRRKTTPGGEDGDDQSDGGTAQIEVARRSAMNVHARIQSIKDRHSGKVSLHFTALVDMIVAFREGQNTASTTDLACSRLFNLYRPQDRVGIRRQLTQMGLVCRTWAAALQQCKNADKKKDLDEKLKALNKLAVEQDKGGRLLLWVTRVVNTVLQLKFVVEYNPLPKKEKSKLIDSLFEAEMAHELARLRASTDHSTTTKKLKKTYRKALSKRVLAMRHTFRLYQIFGANVIADCLFHLVPQGSLNINGKNLQDITVHLMNKRATIIDELGLLEAFRDQFNTASPVDAQACEEYINACHTNTSTLVTEIVTLAAGADIGKYVGTFLGCRAQMAGTVLQD